MSKSKHTPGPWAIGVYKATPEFRAHDEHVCVMKENTGLLLAVTGPTLDAASVADAQLIAAAPDLYIWAKDLVERIEANPRRIMFDTDTSDSYRMLKKAIAKAEGKGRSERK